MLKTFSVNTNVNVLICCNFESDLNITDISDLHSEKYHLQSISIDVGIRIDIKDILCKCKCKCLDLLQF
jgi:hypothetical protein